MPDSNYWKLHYVGETNPDEIEQSMGHAAFTSAGQGFELVHFGQAKDLPNILISPGSGGHAFVFAELGYRLHRLGYNVFIMPKHGGRTVAELMQRHRDALQCIASLTNDRIGVFAEGLGGYVCFYLALAHGPMKSLVCQNAPAILTEPQFQEAIFAGRRSARRRRAILPLARLLARAFPRLPIPIQLYLDFRELADQRLEEGKLERARVERFLQDPDFDRWYPLAAVLSLLTTPPPNQLG